MIGVGDKVVCINDSGFEFVTDPDFIKYAKPIKGCVYTVRGVAIDVFGVPGFLLAEIRRPDYCNEDGLELGWLTHRFRPVKKTKTDISIFQEIDREIFSKDKVSA